MNHSLSHSPTWIQEMLAHLKTAILLNVGIPKGGAIINFAIDTDNKMYIQLQ